MSERELRITGDYKERERERILRRSTRSTSLFGFRALLPTDVTSARSVRPSATAP